MNDTALISLNEVCRRTSLSRTTINTLRDQGKFPKPVILGYKRIAFVPKEIDAWINERIAARNGERAAS